MQCIDCFSCCLRWPELFEWCPIRLLSFSALLVFCQLGLPFILKTVNLSNDCSQVLDTAFSFLNITLMQLLDSAAVDQLMLVVSRFTHFHCLLCLLRVMIVCNSSVSWLSISNCYVTNLYVSVLCYDSVYHSTVSWLHLSNYCVLTLYITVLRHESVLYITVLFHDSVYQTTVSWLCLSLYCVMTLFIKLLCHDSVYHCTVSWLCISQYCVMTWFIKLLCRNSMYHF